MFKILVLCLFIINLNAKEVYNVDELLVEALKNSPDIQTSLSEYKASKSRKDIATSSYLPKVDLHLGLGEMGIKNTQTNGMTNDTLIMGKLSLRQLIYDFGKTSGDVDFAKYDSESYFNLNEQKISDKKRDVKLSYYGVLESIALIDVAKENLKLNKIQLYRSQKYFEAGIKTKIDVSDAKVQLIKSKLNLKQTQYDLKMAYASLDEVVGFEEATKSYVVYSYTLDLDNIYSTLKDYPLNLNEAIEFAYHNRYEIKRYLFDIKAKEALNKSTKADLYPKLYLDADYTKQDTDKLQDYIPEDQWQGTLNLDWNIYSGGATTASMQEKRIGVEISKSKLRTLKLSIKKETTQAYLNLYKMKDSIELSQSLLEVSKEKFEQAQKRYEHGLSDYIEIQQAREGYIDAKVSLVIDYYKYFKAITTLDNVIGR